MGRDSKQEWDRGRGRKVVLSEGTESGPQL